MTEDLPSADEFARLSMELHSAEGVEETVEAVVQFALQAVGCKYASVVLLAAGARPEIMALTDPKLAELYYEQLDAGEGPLLTTIRQKQALLITDVAAETRWTAAWAAGVQAAGIRCALHLPLMVGPVPRRC